MGAACATAVKTFAIGLVPNCAAGLASRKFAAGSETCGTAMFTLGETASRGGSVAETGVFDVASKALNDTVSMLPARMPTGADPSTRTAGLSIPLATPSRAMPGDGDKRAGVAIIDEGSSGKFRIVLIKIRAS
jgi:hypothetical protein